MYMGMGLFTSTILILLMFALYLSVKFTPMNLSLSGHSPFECGFETSASTRRPFSVRFFILVTLFLVFDVESVMLFPLIGNLIQSPKLLILSSLSFFVFLLFLGLLYEWYNTLLEWIYFK